MPASTLLSERPTEHDEFFLDAAPSAARTARWPVLAMVIGVVIVALAAAGLVRAREGAEPVRQVPGVGEAAAPSDPLAITLSARDVSVVTQVYEAGEDSGWHSHPGIHAVAIVSGELTVYDSQCQRLTFRPGQPYVGGQQLHLVRNETDAPVVMAVTYLSPSSPGGRSTEPASDPAGCAAG